MTQRVPLDDMTSDQLDQLHDALDRVRTYATRAIDAGDTGPGPDLGRLLLQLLDGEQPASTAPLAAGLPLVQGRCPACGRTSLFLGAGGHITCATSDCLNPASADEVLRHAHLTECKHAPGQRQAEAALARVRQACASVQATGKGFTPTKPYDKGAAKAVDWVVMRVLEAIDARLVNGTPATPAAPTPGPCPACRRADQAGLAGAELHDDCAKEQR